MAITYTWEFPALDCYPTQEGKENVIFTVHWRLQGKDDKGNTGEMYSSVGLTLDPDAEFIPFESLTKETVQGWVETIFQNMNHHDDISTLDFMKANIEAQIQEKINPSRVTKIGPWTTTAF